MSQSIMYVSRRVEVMAWYWQMWRKQLWKIHLLMFATVAFLASRLIFDGAPTSLLGVLLIASIGLAPIVAMVLFPLLKFKPQKRTLSIDEQGITTTIGDISKSVPWKDIANVSVDQNNLIIQNRNLNAFIIPQRAFETDEARQGFKNFVVAHVQASGS